MAWEEYRDAMRTRRDGIRNDNTEMEMNLLRVKDNNKKGFCRYFGKKRKAKNILPLINGKGQLAMTHRRLRNSNVFASVFISSQVACVS